MTLTTEDVSKLTGLSMSSVYRLMANGEIPYTKTEYRAEFEEDDVQHFIKKREGIGVTVPSTPIYQSGHITCLFSMLTNFIDTHQDDSTYQALFTLDTVLKKHFSAALEAFSKGRHTTFNGSKINHVLEDLRKQAHKKPDHSATLLFLVGELHSIFSNPRSLNERILMYTQMLLDVVVHANKKPIDTIQIYLPEGELRDD